MPPSQMKISAVNAKAKPIGTPPITQPTNAASMGGPEGDVTPAASQLQAQPAAASASAIARAAAKSRTLRPNTRASAKTVMQTAPTPIG